MGEGWFVWGEAFSQGEKNKNKKASSYILYFGLSRLPAATLKRWQALQIGSGLVSLQGVLDHVTHMCTHAPTAERVFE